MVHIWRNIPPFVKTQPLRLIYTNIYWFTIFFCGYLELTELAESFSGKKTKQPTNEKHKTLGIQYGWWRGGE